MNAQKVNTLTLNGPGYPDILRTIDQPPEPLYYRGAEPQSWLNQPKVAVVGSRKMTGYGRLVTEKIVTELARAGAVIVSGLAYGIDATAQRAAVDAGGIAVAVLGTGINHISPAGNVQLGHAILANKGTIFSEYGPADRVFASNFVIRDRIISGLCDVLLITEAALKSGSLHTARFALEQGKTVMAVPGSILSPTSEGCNNLIRSGAVPATSAEDVFFALGIKRGNQKMRLDFKGSPEEEKILTLIKSGCADQEELALAAGLEGSQIAGALTSLELQGQIRPVGAGNWTVL